MHLSVIICTHNPRPDYFERVLAALQAQTLPQTAWEVVVVDNKSESALDPKTKKLGDTLPAVRLVREEELGLTFARLRGIAESAGALLVFVDDDNVLAPDYLEQALAIADRFPMLGAWGGQTIPEFESEPPAWTRPYWSRLAIRRFKRDSWSNLAAHLEIAPCGAGLCLRREVATRYAKVMLEQPQRAKLDRKGRQLTGAGDWDMALTACDIGLGMGLFTALRLTHLMPAFRLEEDYLLRLVEAGTYSSLLLQGLRGWLPPAQIQSHRLKLWQGLANWYKRRRLSPRQRRFHAAIERGSQRAYTELEAIRHKDKLSSETTGRVGVPKKIAWLKR
jgi:glycosyltransferase involved in cell wall biosynthesis